MNGRAVPCRRHRRALEAFVDRGERGPATPAALDHLGVCARCEREMTELALTIVALRRTGREVYAAPVPAVAPARVAALAIRRRTPWPHRLQLGSLLAGAAIVAAVVLPSAGRAQVPASDALGSSRPVAAAPWRAAESRIAAAPDDPSFAAPIAPPPRYPEGRTRPWKEVSTTDATPRVLEPR